MPTLEEDFVAEHKADTSSLDEAFTPASLDESFIPESKPGKKGLLSTILGGLSTVGEAMAKNQLPQEGVPALTREELGIPKLGEPGSVTRGVTDAVGGLVEGALTPEGIVAAGLLPVPGVGKAVGAALTFAAVKPISQLVGEASVTKSPETIAKAATFAAVPIVGHLIAKAIENAPPLTKAALEETPKTGEPNATETGKISQDVLGQRAGTDALGSPADASVSDSLQRQAQAPEVAQETPVAEQPPKESFPTADAQIATPTISEGPGAASPGDVPQNSQLSQLTEAIKPTEPVKRPIISQVASDLGRAYEQITDKAETALSNLKALGANALTALKGEQPWTDFKDALGKFSGAKNRNDFELQQFTKEIRRVVPDNVRREAIVNWIQSDGDNAVLGARAVASKKGVRPGYETAQQLTPDEVTLAGNVRSYLDAKLQEGIDAGLLTEGVENYVTQLWDKPNPISNKLIGEAVSGKLAPNFKFARQRIFDSYFEGEQAGYKPKIKDIGALIAAYDQSFSRSIYSRALIKALHAGKASDGRPLVEVSGVSNLLSENGSPEALLIKPRAKPEELGGYLPVDHPALRGWKWAGTDPETGASILYQGDMVVHPEVHTHLKNVLSSSALRQNAFFRTILKGQNVLKQSKLALSGFHFTQEGAHAASHRVNPLAPEKIDFSIKDQSSLVDHGLQVADYRAYQAFSEGISGAGSIYEKVPVVGKWLTRYNEYLFQEYIPRLKMTMAMDALERNRNRFAGKLSDDQILELTSKQSNAAFGELNYTMMGRNPTLQDFFRLAALAPDFLEARFRFAAQAFTKTGGEQRMAIALQAATLYVGARILNQALDGDPHWEPKYAFDVVVNKRQYGIRSVAEDTAHLISDPSQFIANRLAPFAKAAVEFVTHRDWRGIKRTSVQQLEDIASWLTPITFGRQVDRTKLDTTLSAAGVTVRSATAQQRLYDKLKTFKTDKGLLTKDELAGMISPSEYSPLKNALMIGNENAARAEYDTLIHPSDGSKPKTPAQVRQHFIDSVRAPFSGSRRIEMQFLKSLDKSGNDLYLEARQERKNVALKFVEAQRKWITEDSKTKAPK